MKSCLFMINLMFHHKVVLFLNRIHNYYYFQTADERCADERCAAMPTRTGFGQTPSAPIRLRSAPRPLMSAPRARDPRAATLTVPQFLVEGKGGGAAEGGGGGRMRDTSGGKKEGGGA